VDSQVDSRAQLIESIRTLPEDSVAELSSFVSYLRYKADKEAPTKKSAKDFLLSISGIGESDETDISERDEEILTQEINPIGGWSLHTDKSA